MSSRLAVLAVAGLFVALPFSAQAQVLIPGEPILSVDEAREVALDQGVTRFDSMELDMNSGRWEVEGVDMNNRDVDLEIDARTGTIVNIER